MDIPKSQVKKALTTQCKFTQLGFNMLVTRLSGLYSKDASDAILEHCTHEINSFYSKYQSIMQKDYETITKL